MPKPIHVTFDGKVLVPDEPLDLPPNARFTVTINGEEHRKPLKPYEGLQRLAELDLEGPPDSSVKFREYLYGLSDDGGA